VRGVEAEGEEEEDEYYAYDYGDYDGEDGEGEVDETHVKVLEEGTFQEALDGHELALVEFYAPWCGHCKQLKPEYAKAAAELSATHPEVLIAKVDATEQESLASRYGVEGYPTLKWFVSGEPKDYTGGRTAEEIVSWVSTMSGPAVHVLKSAQDLGDFTTAHKTFVVALFDKLEGGDYDEFAAAADEHRAEVVFAATADKGVARAAASGLSSPGIAMVKEEGTVVYEGEVSSAAVGTWALRERLPTVIPFNEDNSEVIFGSGISRHLLLFHSTDSEEELVAPFAAAAKKHKGNVIFVTVAIDEEATEGVLEFFGLDVTNADGVVFGFRDASSEEGGEEDEEDEEREPEPPAKFKFTGGLTEAELSAFAQGLVDGTLEPYLKSEDPPADNSGPVTIVVGTTFEAICKDPKKDVLLEVYAPWCGHCKQLEPTYRKLGKRFEKVDSVVIAKMDGTQNEHPEVRVEGFPTILFFPAGEGAKPVRIEEARTLKELTVQVKKHATIPYELPKKPQAAGAAEGGARDEL